MFLGLERYLSRRAIALIAFGIIAVLGTLVFVREKPWLSSDERERQRIVNDQARVYADQLFEAAKRDNLKPGDCPELPKSVQYCVLFRDSYELTVTVISKYGAEYVKRTHQE